ncbi:MAG: hypothetical protein AB7G23_10220 [Vicinamibacterales bacterium]
MSASFPSRARAAVMAAVAVALFFFNWLFRFNDPGGSFAGLTDDHFFYLVRGWQILFGELPVRDFVDHGAPLFYYVGAAVQWLGGRGTLSELVFTVTVLSACVSATFLLATRVSGSIVIALVAVAFQVLLEPRFYNYPKILVYVAAIPAIWAVIDRVTTWRLALVALVTAVGFLFRHDHAAFVGVGMAVALASLTGVPWGRRVRHALVYGVLVLAMLAPYLAFIEVNGGFVSYLREGSEWAAHDRARAPVIWPGLFDNPDGVSDAAADGMGPGHVVAVLRDNRIAWLYYLELILPVLALGVLALARDGFRPGWPRAVPKMLVVCVLGLVLNAGFLRSPLAARLADPSVPHVLLLAWMLAAAWALLVGRARGLRGPVDRHVRVATAGVVVAVAAVGLVSAATLSHDLYDRLDNSTLLDGVPKAFDRGSFMWSRYADTWPIEKWVEPGTPHILDLAVYLRDCTVPTDRIFMQHYLPQVLALSERAFAGGHADLRPGFFGSEEAQQLTVARLARQSVPVVLLASGQDLENFRKELPIVTAYFDEHYHLEGERSIDGRFEVTLLAANDRRPIRRDPRFDWPCYR